MAIYILPAIVELPHMTSRFLPNAIRKAAPDTASMLLSERGTGDSPCALPECTFIYISPLSSWYRLMFYLFALSNVFQMIR